MPHRPEISAIPLSCQLCPKHPKFSDISHMLTHISSKGHLANRFKLQICAQSDLAAKAELDEYDHFHRKHGLDTLLSNRLATKNNKKAARERREKAKLAAKSPVKTETGNEQSIADELAVTPIFRAPVPRMHLWSTSRSHESTDEGEENMRTPTGYGSPNMAHRIPNFSSFDDSSCLDPQIIQSQLSDVKTPASRTSSKKTPSRKNPKTPRKSNVGTGQTPDSARLKGVLFPGMDLFDSATEEMKRTRNQRKSHEAMKHMIAKSREIEPNMVVYDAAGGFHESRSVFDPPSCESSPSKDSSARKRKYRKPALEDVSINAPRARGRKPRGASVPKPPYQQASEQLFVTRPMPTYVTPIPNPLANFGNRFGLGSIADEEFSTTGGQVRKRGFSVLHETPANSPGRTESPAMEYRTQGSRREGSVNPFAAHLPLGMSEFTGKENEQTQDLVRRSYSAPQAFHGYVNHDSHYNPLTIQPLATQRYGMGHDHTDMTQGLRNFPVMGSSSQFRGFVHTNSYPRESYPSYSGYDAGPGPHHGM